VLFAAALHSLPGFRVAEQIELREAKAVKKILMVIGLSVSLLTGNAWADTLTLRDGTRRSGRLISATSDIITFRDDRGEQHRYSVSEVQQIEFNNLHSRENAGDDNGNYQRRDSPRNSRDVVLVPSGTELVVRTNEVIDSRTARDAQAYYTATIDRDVADSSGEIVIPRGSDARLIVRNTTSDELVLDLDSITVDGRRYRVTSSDVEQDAGRREGIGTNKRTAEMVGGGAVLGTLLGAIAGGGKGAAIGAIAGGVTGGVAQVLTRGKEVRVPAETLLRFRLDAPLRLEGERDSLH
jgi:hypothetical protein